MTEANATVTKPLYATVGAGDALYTAFAQIVDGLRERAATADVSGRVEEARERIANLPADAQERIETLRQRLSTLPSELPDDVAELREKLTSEELRRLVDQYYHQLLDLYSDLAVRGEGRVGKLRETNPAFDEQFVKVEGTLTDVVARAEDVLGKVTEQARGLLGKAAEEVEETEDAVEAEIVSVTNETAPTAPVAESPAKKAAPAKKAPAKKAPAKKATSTGTTKK
ncbi:heparin-binding hemagglutinin [Nocardia sp. CDC159]|uniref:Heparin-binding hemagglutinin n=1 Tax=Nocardia pulmonis TaxID=2951408 RepID=A0A9X2IXN7_9NOCA|nr:MULTISPECIES: heparin-binding hemagglutinin [Nocardia]MCM6774834.1 heparin-binding hemagglutinin [Nocardia pulmonis]MCM6789765.1 heparin-binding hemagglutinin [Nocardia sp. CDC159]